MLVRTEAGDTELVQPPTLCGLNQPTQYASARVIVVRSSAPYLRTLTPKPTAQTDITMTVTTRFRATVFLGLAATQPQGNRREIEEREREREKKKKKKKIEKKVRGIAYSPSLPTLNPRIPTSGPSTSTILQVEAQAPNPSVRYIHVLDQSKTSPTRRVGWVLVFSSRVGRVIEDYALDGFEGLGDRVGDFGVVATEEVIEVVCQAVVLDQHCELFLKPSDGSLVLLNRVTPKP